MAMSINCTTHKCETMPSYVNVNSYTGTLSSEGHLGFCFQGERLTDFARVSIDVNYCPFCGKKLGEEE
jgi:hypothetical protein